MPYSSLESVVEQRLRARSQISFTSVRISWHWERQIFGQG
ncbi:hypothetical protein ACCUM_3162 [Candidatus Accumulibacter phosphatis]|uniref:Uncharacterized protein n=1 Tax=Candidatus Accumulibacter phosphatis TaxID=327160 RepID=A0A5S4EQ04_9PROT|nr:hypothetical protein ACCUM_3162 [Candidatus Accumulibacter phosphatis]